MRARTHLRNRNMLLLHALCMSMYKMFWEREYMACSCRHAIRKAAFMRERMKKCRHAEESANVPHARAQNAFMQQRKKAKYVRRYRYARRGSVRMLNVVVERAPVARYSRARCQRAMPAGASVLCCMKCQSVAHAMRARMAQNTPSSTQQRAASAACPSTNQLSSRMKNGVRRLPAR